MKEGDNISFDELIIKLGVSEKDYILAIRSSLKCPTIFLKRQPHELRINNYNTACLQAWRATMNIQFVLDVYACAMYIVSHLSKAQKGMSELLRNASAEARKCNSTIKQEVRDIGNRFLNSVEIIAQEVVYILLLLPMGKSSREVVFVNNSPPKDRVQLLKIMDDINEMDDEDEDVYTSGLLKRYINRAANLEQVSQQTRLLGMIHVAKDFRKKSLNIDVDGLPFDTYDDDNNDDEGEHINQLAKCKKRVKARIIRSVFFNNQQGN